MSLATGCSVLSGGSDYFAPEHESTALIRSVVQTPLDTRRFESVGPQDEVLGGLQVLYAQHEDTLSDLARAHDVGYRELRAANPDVDPWLPGPGTPVYLPTLVILPDAPRDGIVINLPTMRLFEFEQRVGDGASPVQRVYSLPVGIGREGWATPTGLMRVVQKTRDPSWHPPASVRAEHAAAGDPLPKVVPPGPDNPLGRFKMRLSRPSYLIHGTNKPAGVGMRVSHGCIRLYPEDIASLFERVALSTPVHIVDQPVLAGWRGGELYLEVHPPLAEDDRDLMQQARAAIDAARARAGAATVTLDRDLIAQLVRERRGVPVPVSRPGLTLAAYLARARVIENGAARDPGKFTASR